ncbi:hypothetical protein Y900_021460 [Mycolicibacterium aromaticivorans JS19b1 = JCM 16368]|uniref:Uncharacterized protein n=1 Tax=Mycolicibacterium aromaticivorans JS19b1 = JCM 16368 TaxID=1440774 RepID=A0A064CLI8_9MYCO|nr:hypothetical protein Y900_021460 [Mycolicibacterium aromaticivorans JS19b1 = JCM 16368]
MVGIPAEQHIIDQLVERLALAYPQIGREQVNRTVNEEYGRFDDRPIRDFIPLFVERHAVNRLSELVGS